MHEIDSRGFRYTLAASGMAASLVFLLASMFANYRYGSSLARTELEGYAYGGAAAACDILMAASPFFFFASLKQRNYTQAFAAFLLWATMTSVALVSAIAQTSANRIDAISSRISVSNTYADARTELVESRKARGFIPQHRPEAVVKADIEKHKTNKHWLNSNECTDISGKAQREYCGQYAVLSGELGYAQQAARLDARIDAMTSKSDRIAETNTNVVQSEADPGAKTLSLISGYDIRSVQSAMVGLMALMFLVGAGLGPYTSWSVMEGINHKLAIVDITPSYTLTADPPRPEPTPPKTLALPKPEAEVSGTVTPEWRAVLDELGIPRKKRMGALDPKEDQDKLGWRWYCWLVSHGHVGQFAAEKMDGLYDAYGRVVHCEPTAYRIAKNRLEQVRWVSKTANPVVWTIKPPTNGVETLRRVLVSKKILPETPAAPVAPEEENVVTFKKKLFWRSA